MQVRAIMNESTTANVEPSDAVQYDLESAADVGGKEKPAESQAQLGILQGVEMLDLQFRRRRTLRRAAGIF